MEKYFEYKFWSEIIWYVIASVAVLILVIAYLVCLILEKKRNKRRKK